jgi:hypothetical protein
MKQLLAAIIFSFSFLGCGSFFRSEKVADVYIIDPASTVSTRFIPPESFKRIGLQAKSFGEYLRNLPLKPYESEVKTYSGNLAYTNSYNASVIDISVGEKDLQQCADAIIRLRAEFLWKINRKEEIAFHFTNGMLCKYSEYASGYRFANEHWLKKTSPDTSYKAFQNYLKLVFMYAGTLSLEKELSYVSDTSKVTVGDVFIKGGSPGHCFIVVDVVQNTKGERLMLLAESYMPAQNIHIVKNGENPWIKLNEKPSFDYGYLIGSKYHRRFRE